MLRNQRKSALRRQIIICETGTPSLPLSRLTKRVGQNGTEHARRATGPKNAFRRLIDAVWRISGRDHGAIQRRSEIAKPSAIAVYPDRRINRLISDGPTAGRINMKWPIAARHVACMIYLDHIANLRVIWQHNALSGGAARRSHHGHGYAAISNDRCRRALAGSCGIQRGDRCPTPIVNNRRGPCRINDRRHYTPVGLSIACRLIFVSHFALA